MRLKQAWSCWLKGSPNYRNNVGDGNVPIVKINPFLHIRPTLLPKKIEKQFRNDFKPILSSINISGRY